MAEDVTLQTCAQRFSLEVMDVLAVSAVAKESMCGAVGAVGDICCPEFRSMRFASIHSFDLLILVLKAQTNVPMRHDQKVAEDLRQEDIHPI